MTANQTTDRNHYGATETNGLINAAEYHDSVDYTDQYSLAQVAAEGGKITRVRILTERTFGGTLCDISYIHATLRDGRTVPVQVSGMTNCTPLRDLKGAMIAWAKSEHVFAKSLGLLDEGNWSILR